MRFKPRFKAHSYSLSNCAFVIVFIFMWTSSSWNVTVIAVIYCYITTDFHYAKRDSHLSACRGVMLQRVGIEKNVNRHFSLNLIITRTDLNALLSFFSHLAFQGDPKPFKRFIAFWVSSSVVIVRRVKGTYLILKSLLLEAKGKTLEACRLPQFLHRIIVQG